MLMLLFAHNSTRRTRTRTQFFDEIVHKREKNYENKIEIENTKPECCYLKQQRKASGEKKILGNFICRRAQSHCKYAFIITINKIQRKKHVCGSQNKYNFTICTFNIEL